MNSGSSLFINDEIDLTQGAELLPTGGATSDCYRVKLYGKWFFLKRLKEKLRSSPRYLALMRKEFETGFQLEHPHLVKYVRLGDDFIITEFVDGTTLTDFIATHADFFNDKQNTLRLLTQLLDAVAYLHSHQVVHLDLKPDNIMITRIGNDLKIIDLGFCYTDSFQDTIGGTERFAAPEQFNGGRVDERSDIFAIGRILEQLPCAARYRKVISRCTNPDPDRRYPTAGAVLKAIRQCHDRPRRVAIAAAVAAAGLAIAAGLYFLRQPGVTAPAPAVEQDTVAAPTSTTAPTAAQPSITAPAETQPSATAPAVAQPSADSKATTTTTKQKPSIDALHNKIAAWLTPRFNREFGAMRDSAYSQIDWNAYGWRFSYFRSAQYHKYMDEIGAAPYEEREVSREYSKVLLALDRDLINQTKHNTPKTSD